MTVSPADIDLGRTPRIPYDRPAAPDDAVPFAIFDVGHTLHASIAKLPALRRVCDQHSARLMIDDAHGLGILGRTERR